jgi:flavorubredoxin
MIQKKIDDGIFMLTMNVEEMKFEGMWDLPHGVTMNSYIVKGDKVAIVDGVIGWDGVPKSLFNMLGEMDIKLEDIEYVVVNHMEPDHSGWIEDFKKIRNDFTLVTTKKGEPIVRSFYGEDLNIMVVDEGDSIDLGKGKTLTFYPTPNVHWPETMLTFEKSSGILFSCDMFGAFGTLYNGLIDDEMAEDDLNLHKEEAIRYYSNVMTTFSPMVKRAIQKTKEIAPKVIAPGHGPVYRSNPESIIDLYSSFTEYANGFGRNEITILWGSMYGITGKAVNYVQNLLEERGFKVNNIQMPYTSQSDMVTSVFRSAAVIVAGSTYEYKMFPPVAHAIDELGRKKITSKTSYFFGSYGWNPSAKRDFLNILDSFKMKWDVIEPYEFKGTPTEQDLENIKKGVLNVIKNMQEKII